MVPRTFSNRCENDSHNTNSYMKFHITILRFIKSPSDSVGSKIHCDTEEKRWMHRLTTIMPPGLNLMDQTISILHPTIVCLL